MAVAAVALTVFAYVASIAGMVILCHEIEIRNKAEAWRETYGLSVREDCWP